MAKIFLYIFILASIVFVFLTWTQLNKNLDIFMNVFPAQRIVYKNDTDTSPIQHSRVMKIVTWTNFFGVPMGKEYLDGCPFRNQCTISPVKNHSEHADALVFHIRDMVKLPEFRNPDQIYVLLSLEAPPNTGLNWNAMSDFFNWTMTYRMDSDVPYPYSYLMKSEDPPKSTIDLYDTILKRKKNLTTLVAWFVSNCKTHSKRESYVKILRNFIGVDVYGYCGTLSCPRSGQTRCDRLVNDRYKFYLAFENSLCVDYVTEKIYNRITSWNAVPIVLKRSIVQGYLPNGSFIAADDFKHPMRLVQYLKYLDSNDTAYLEYFQWRNHGYRSSNHDRSGSYFAFCGLCQRLLLGSYPRKSYHDLRTWWIDGGRCDSDMVHRLISHKL